LIIGQKYALKGGCRSMPIGNLEGTNAAPYFHLLIDCEFRRKPAGDSDLIPARVPI